ncbi:MAG: TetR/AcrR family transcriptional regulator [Kiloniellaceae bacterium]
MAQLLERELDGPGAVAGVPAPRAVSPKRKAIVQAAAELFIEAGYGAASMDAIAARAEVSKRTVYGYFPGKDALFGAVMGDVCASVVGPQVPDRLTDGPPRRVLTEYGRTFLTLITSREALSIFRVVVAESERFPELGMAFCRAGPQRWTNILAAYLRAQDRKANLRVPDPEAAATRFLAMVKGPVHMRLTLGVGPHPGAREVDAVVDAAVAAFLRGHGAAGGHAD